MSILQLPSEVIIEIFKYLNHFEFIIQLSLVCKNWKLILENDDYGFYKYLYHSYFTWRNNPQSLQHLQLTYQQLFQNEIKFWKNWNFQHFPLEFQVTNNYNKTLNENNKNLLQIKRLQTLDYKNYIHNKPLFYNTGIYYFEIQSLKDHGTSDNIVIGFLLKQENENAINLNNYLGSNGSNSFGLFFCTGGMLGVDIVNNNDSSIFTKHIPKFTKVGVYLDTNSLIVKYVLVKEEKICGIVNLEKHFTKEQLDGYCKGRNLALFPAISMLYEGDILELDVGAGFRSVKKANWVKNFFSEK